MEFFHSSKISTEYARKALSLMTKNGVAPHPNNFTVWYCYVSGDWPELAQDMDSLLESGSPVNDEQTAALFEKFCAPPFQAIPLHRIAERFQTEMTSALGTLDQACTDASAYGDMLEAAIDEVGSAPRSEPPPQLLNRLVAETRAMTQLSRDNEQKLSSAREEIDQLRAELETARKEALTDSLTAIANRKMFDAALRTAVRTSVETDAPLSLLLLDIDHFKKFNDDFGHLIGDQVLRLLAVVLRENVKGQDTPARFGGEEFSVILPNTQASDARKLADNIRRNIGDRRLFNRQTGERLRQITVSIGVAQFRSGESIVDFVERADRALYFAKRLGRNQVVVEDDMRMLRQQES